MLQFLRVMERWSHPSASRVIHNNHHETEYNTVDDQKEYEDVDFYYGRQSDTSGRSTRKIPLLNFEEEASNLPEITQRITQIPPPPPPTSNFEMKAGERQKYSPKPSQFSRNSATRTKSLPIMSDFEEEASNLPEKTQRMTQIPPPPPPTSNYLENLTENSVPNLLALVGEDDLIHAVLPIHSLTDFGDIEDISRARTDTLSVRSIRSLKSIKSARVKVQSPAAPSIPPPIPSMGTLNRPIHATHLAIHTPRSQKRIGTSRWQLLCGGLILTAILLLLIVTIIAFLVLGMRSHSFFKSQSSNLEEQVLFSQSKPSSENRNVDAEISPNHLLTLLITKRKVCLFEASTDDVSSSLKAFTNEHIESAQLLFYGNLSHAGVPVHPLQFQRVVRGLGVDSDCHVVIYDRGYVIWSTYAMWIFRLYGHNRVSILEGGFENWKALQAQSKQYRTEAGFGRKISMGTIVGSWNSSLITTYDDVLGNTETDKFDLIDAQTKDEYSGRASGALFGHIRGSFNLPIETIFDWEHSKWLSSQELIEIFKSTGITRRKSVIVYCSTSVRASMVWWILSREGFSTSLYFGGWPEWLVRAPDYLKVLPPQ